MGQGSSDNPDRPTPPSSWRSLRVAGPAPATRSHRPRETPLSRWTQRSGSRTRPSRRDSARTPAARTAGAQYGIGGTPQHWTDVIVQGEDGPRAGQRAAQGRRVEQPDAMGEAVDVHGGAGFPVRPTYGFLQSLGAFRRQATRGASPRSASSWRYPAPGKLHPLTGWPSGNRAPFPDSRPESMWCPQAGQIAGFCVDEPHRGPSGPEMGQNGPFWQEGSGRG